ncbi:respiratory nitrate reductase subunit gamma [Geobacillus stearothermophilus]|uniref:Nitrate reductase subunit gamma n=1 Tax=Geobacillus thermopakistaniensis (strain MAS1) TaxID=1408282 RepID=A0A7U9P4R7_GEOTM|nr:MULTISPECIES: respiratory nitrate reductase subunit gamma [Geobacillus]MED5075227.1 respiratory nitrate reductase subunit gamma [Anoxybacillus geothermalis]AMV11017.1 nitrate reductase [Geobacillus thermoleovorans]AOL34630.1 respiratory nitrate reductase subunit gamma [Geobacillus thermoleovorans]ESU70660.1 nitrate reductase subunit gamma [Geobacillus sp. MAS1]KZM57082.1 nitrate reductase [Geobacillus stearothermophilus]
MASQFLWVIVPYLALVLFVAGHIWRYQRDQFGWTSKSSELLEKRQLRLGSLLFHWGILFVFVGHVMGILIPEPFYEALGVTEEMYHALALAGGIPAGLAAFVGFVILFRRRLTVKRVRTTSSTGDWVALGFLLVVIASGLSSTFLNIDSHGFDYRTTIGPWFRGLLTFRPNPAYMEAVPLWFQIHILAAFGLFAVWPFTRLVHVFSFPLRYLQRSYVVYRKRMPKQAEPVNRAK